MSLFIMRDEPRFSFDVSPEELYLPMALSALLRNHQHRPREGQVVAKKDKNVGFEVSLDVQQFKPEEITVKVVDKSIIVEGKHEERQDQHGFVSREFQRRYVMPEDCDIDKVASSLSADGVLTLTAPKIQAVETGERIIPVIHTGPLRQQEKNTMVQKPTTSDEK